MSTYIPRRRDGSPKSRYYQYDFQLKVAGGRESVRFHGSTGQTTKRAADRVEARIRERAAAGELSSDLTVNQAAWDYYAEVHAGQRSAHNQATNLEHVVRLLGPATLLVDITPADVARAIRRRAGEEAVWKGKINGREVTKRTGKIVSASTVNRQVAEPLRRILRRAKRVWCVPLDLDQFDWSELMLPEPPPRAREFGSEEEARFWSALRQDYHPIALFYLNSGRRRSDLTGLLKFKVDLTDRTVRWPRLKRKNPGGEIVQKLSPTQHTILAQEIARSPGEHVFTYVVQRGKRKGERRPITDSGLRRVIENALAAAGIEDFRIHDFRHTFGTQMMRVSRNPKKVQLAMDHADITSTFRYVHVLEDEVVDDMEAVARSRNSPGAGYGRSKQALENG